MARSMVSLGPLVGSGPSINKDTDEVPMGIICNQANSVSGLCISESSTKCKSINPISSAYGLIDGYQSRDLIVDSIALSSLYLARFAIRYCV